jgi:acyl dehydratase
MQIDEVRAAAGREVGVSGWREVTQELVDSFAALTGDRQWIHVEAERSRRNSPFGGTVAHGFLTVSLLSSMVHEAVAIEADCRMRINYGFNRLRFPAPVVTGSRIRARVTANAVRDVEAAVEIAWGVVVEIEGKEKPALAAEWLVRLYW